MKHLSLPALLFTVAGVLLCQTPSGSVSGSVFDSSGAQVAGATVRITNVATHETHTATSSASGGYVFPVVPTGEYVLEAEAAGFKREQHAGVNLDVNQNARVDFSLHVGAVKDVVEVTGDAPMVDTHDVQLGETVDRKRIEDLPLNGRNVYDLISLMPGATNVTAAVTGTNDANNMNVNGNRSRDNNFYLDGGPNNALFRNGGNMSPNPDAVEEFHLITSNFDAEYGRLPGSVLNVVTRSGKNEFHGSAFEFLRNDTVNARNFFQTSFIPLRWNQYGGTFGGPIRKDRTFFFASYQGFRESTSSLITGALLPTVAQRQGDFSALASNKRPNDPLNGQPFPGGIIPTSRLDPVAQNILQKMIPLNNSPDGTSYSTTAPSPISDDQWIARVDHQLTASNRVSGSMFIDRSNTSLPFQSGTQVPNWANTNAKYSQNNVIISDSWILSPALISESRFSYTLNKYATLGAIRTSWPDFGSSLVLGALPPRPPSFTVTGDWKAGTFGEDTMPQSTYAASERLSWIHGGHSIRAGGSVQWNHFLEDGNWLGAGQITFSGTATGNAQADFLLGQAATFRQNSGLNRNFSGSNSSLFVQDDWKAARRLTVNLGVRWELNPPYTSAGNALGTFQFGVQSQKFSTAPLGMLFPGDPGVPDGIAPTIYTNFGPRVGLSYDVFGNGKTAIRAGYGVFYGVGMVNLVSNLQNQPFIVDITLNGTRNLADPWASVGAASPYPYTLNTQHPIFSYPISQNYLGENSGTPYVQQYNFMVQQQIGRTMSLQAGYVGNTGRKLFIMRDANSPVYKPGASTVANLATRRPYLPSLFGGIYESETGGNSSYSALQATFTRRFARGISVMANYSFSKSIDLVDDEATSISNVTEVNSNNIALDRGLSGFNTPHVFHMSWVWESPAIGGFGWIGKQVLSGWQITGITVARSGQSINVTSGVDTNVDGNNNDRPNLAGDPNISGSRSRGDLVNAFFNKAAFAALPAGQLYGTAGRNIILGPNSVNWNAAAFKEFRVTEKSRLQFRTDFFNIFNEVNFSNPNTTLTSASFGKITAAGPPRMLQFGLKFLF